MGRDLKTRWQMSRDLISRGVSPQFDLGPLDIIEDNNSATMDPVDNDVSRQPRHSTAGSNQVLQWYDPNHIQINQYLGSARVHLPLE